MTKTTIKKLVTIRNQLAKVEEDLYAEGEREVVKIVKAAKRELDGPTLDVYLATYEVDDTPSAESSRGGGKS